MPYSLCEICLRQNSQKEYENESLHNSNELNYQQWDKINSIYLVFYRCDICPTSLSHGLFLKILQPGR